MYTIIKNISILYMRGSYIVLNCSRIFITDPKYFGKQRHGFGDIFTNKNTFCKCHKWPFVVTLSITVFGF